MLSFIIHLLFITSEMTYTIPKKVEVAKQTISAATSIRPVAPIKRPEPPPPPPPPVVTTTKITTEIKSMEEERSSSSSSMALVNLVPSSSTIGPFRRHDAPRIRPTKFVPALDYFSSSDRDVSDQELDGIKSPWEPGRNFHEEDQQLSKWRKVTYQVPPSTRKPRRDSLSSLVDHSMQAMNQQFKSNISQFSQGLCYNHMERKIQSDLGSGASEPATDGNIPAIKGGTGEECIVEDGSGANPLIYFKYDFGYEFGIANPRNVRASSEPPAKALPSNQSRKSRRPKSLIADDDGEDEEDDDKPIELPIIHETTTNMKK